MRVSLIIILLGLLHVQLATAHVYRVLISTGYGSTNDKVSIILVGKSGAETGIHDLPGVFGSKTDRTFIIDDTDVGELSAVKIRLVKKGLYEDYWQLRQVVVVTPSRQRFFFSFNKLVKYQWNTIYPNCRRGYKKTSDGQCVDIDECKESGGCKDKIAICSNTIGSFTCSCPKGYNTDYEGGCTDVDECRLNNGKCTEYCINTPGSYYCDCHRSGYQVVDGYRCEDIDECKEGKDGCDKASTTCFNYPGNFRCDCKYGYMAKDRYSCQRRTCSHFLPDRDFYSTLEPARCTQQGQNKYEDKCKVVCKSDGYILERPSAEIVTCSADGYWSPYPTNCIGRPCPLLTDIKNGYVEMGCRVGIPRYGKTCYHGCNGGYNLKGNRNRECLANGTWSGAEPTCEKVHPKPWITCPSNIYVDLKPGMNTSTVGDKWTLPVANVKNITAVEPPGVSSSYPFPAGTTTVKWVAVNEIGEHAFCVIHVVIEDKEKPKVVFCPDRIFKVSFTNSPVWVNITRPVFTDNVGIVKYDPPLIDGNYFTRVEGRNMDFDAVDVEGNWARCNIKVFVGGYRCQLPPEGPPADGWWSCTWNFNSRFCVKQCHSGQKVFGMSVSYTSCTDSDGKWRFWPQQAAPDAYCVGYKDVNASVPCDVGSIRNSSFNQLGCYECPPGTAFKSAVCEACPEGTFQDKTGQTSCKVCPAGTSTSEKRSYACRPVCPPGRYSKDGFGPFCDFCSNGTYQDKAKQTSCVVCPQGTYTLQIGATFCGKSPQISKLEPGDTASVNAGGALVLKCFSEGEPSPSVYWQYPGNGKGSKTQEQMKDKDGNATGTQLTITNADSSDAGDYTCTSANTHGERTRSVHVTVTTSSFKRATIQESKRAGDDFAPRSQAPCPAGKFSSDGMGPLCRVCPKNSYQDQTGETACKNCELGSKTLQLAATSADACGAAPVITSVNSSVNTTSKEAMLDCFVNASPSTLILWRFLEDIPSAFLGIPKLEQLEDDKGEPIGTRLIIRAVTDYNTGQYECTALNPFGQDKKTLHLNVPQI